MITLVILIRLCIKGQKNSLNGWLVRHLETALHANRFIKVGNFIFITKLLLSEFNDYLLMNRRLSLGNRIQTSEYTVETLRFPKAKPEPGLTINSDRYSDTLKLLRVNIKNKNDFYVL